MPDDLDLEETMDMVRKIMSGPGMDVDLVQYYSGPVTPNDLIRRVPINSLMHERVYCVIEKHLPIARGMGFRHRGRTAEDYDEEEDRRYHQAWNGYVRANKLSIIEQAMATDYVLAENIIKSFSYEKSARFLITLYSIKTEAWLGDITDTEKRQDLAVRHGTLSTQQYYHILCHKKAGGRVYEVSPGLAKQLAETELRGLVSEDIRLPYEAICLSVPMEAGLRIWNETTGWHPIESIYIVEDTSTVQTEKPTRCWRFLVCGRSKNQNPFDDALLYFAFYFPENAKVDDLITETRQHIRLVDVERGGEQVGPMVDEWPKVFRWAMNSVIYATWPDAEREHVFADKEARHLWERLTKLPKGKKRDRLVKSFNERDPRRRIYLGRTVTYISRDHVVKDHEPGGAGNPLVLRVRVQGHWKKQFHGPKRALRKLIWIQPYWKGPEEGILGHAVHRLSGSPPAKKEEPPTE